MVRSAVFTLFAVIELLLAVGCMKDKMMHNNPPAAKKTDIYFSGTLRNSNKILTATYWKNDTAVTLGDGTHQSNAGYIAVNGSNVYAAGVTYFPPFQPIATVWKNGSQTLLTSTSVQSNINSIALNGNDVYVAGYYVNSLNKEEAVYWKNGAMVKLAADSTILTQATSVAVSGGHVYVAGWTTNASNQSQATIWKDNVVIFSSTDSNSSAAFAVGINGSDVYAAGVLADLSAVYWKNGATIHMSGSGVDVVQIAFSGSDMYFTGTMFGAALNDPQASVPVVWKNNIATGLTSSSDPSGSAWAIAINIMDIYIAGYYGSNDGYWKNGVFHPINGAPGDVVGIAVVTH